MRLNPSLESKGRKGATLRKSSQNRPPFPPSNYLSLKVGNQTEPKPPPACKLVSELQAAHQRFEQLKSEDIVFKVIPSIKNVPHSQNLFNFSRYK